MTSIMKTKEILIARFHKHLEIACRNDTKRKNIKTSVLKITDMYCEDWHIDLAEKNRKTIYLVSVRPIFEHGIHDKQIRTFATWSC